VFGATTPRSSVWCAVDKPLDCECYKDGCPVCDAPLTEAEIEEVLEGYEKDPVAFWTQYAALDADDG
jgi:hypothetical protein